MDLSIKRLDHLGIISGTIKDLGFIKLIDKRLKKDDQAKVTPGEATAAMILNGLGFVSRVLTLTPQFFETKPLDILIRKGITPEQLNRHKLGRTLDAIANYGCEVLFNEIALSVCNQEGISLCSCHNDTTSFSFAGKYKNQAEDAEVLITHGHSKDKRPDLKQMVLELCVSSDGGIPFMSKLWSGNASDNKVFNERIKSLADAISQSNTGIIHIADSKLYTAKNLAQLGSRYFITRAPSTIKKVQENITQAIKNDIWIEANGKNKLCVFEVKHYGVAQRWIVIHSQQAHERAKKTANKMLIRQEKQLVKDLFHLQAQRFACETDAQMALNKIAKNYAFLEIKDVKISSIESYDKRGRPVAGAVKELAGYKIEASYNINQDALVQEIEQRSCYVLATNVPEKKLSALDVINEYKGQDCAEKGFAFLKSPSFFAASFFMKSSKRIQAMLVIMTLSLLIYKVAQRRLRSHLRINKKTIPNQINKPVQNPTLRWIFQCMEGINYVTFKPINGVIQTIIHGLTELRSMILSCFGKEVLQIYQIF